MIYASFLYTGLNVLLHFLAIELKKKIFLCFKLHYSLKLSKKNVTLKEDFIASKSSKTPLYIVVDLEGVLCYEEGVLENIGIDNKNKSKKITYTFINNFLTSALLVPIKNCDYFFFKIHFVL